MMPSIEIIFEIILSEISSTSRSVQAKSPFDRFARFSMFILCSERDEEI